MALLLCRYLNAKNRRLKRRDGVASLFVRGSGRYGGAEEQGIGASSPIFGRSALRWLWPHAHLLAYAMQSIVLPAFSWYPSRKEVSLDRIATAHRSTDR